MRYFKVTIPVADAIRNAIMLTQGMPNELADEPWEQGGSFNDGVFGYIALHDRYTTGENNDFFQEMQATDGVLEIPREAYQAELRRHSLNEAAGV